MTRAKMCVPRSQLDRDLRDEAKVLTKRLRAMLAGFRLGAIISAMATLEAECMAQLLASEATGCDCISDPANGLYECDSRAKHALTTEHGR